MRFSRRMDNLAPYLFAEMERKISEKRKSGVDVISLGIGDPDLPTPAYIVEEMRRQVADPANDRYPSNWGPPEYANAAASFYKRRFGVDIDPTQEFMALLGAKEGLAHICLSMLDAGDLVLVPDPGYPVYSGGSILAGAEVRVLHEDLSLDLEVDRGCLCPGRCRAEQHQDGERHAGHQARSGSYRNHEAS